MGVLAETEIMYDLAAPMLCGWSVRNILRNDPDRCVKCEKVEACQGAFEQLAPPSRPRQSKRETICAHCGQTFINYQRRKYCSIECYGEARVKPLCLDPSDKNETIHKLAVKYGVSPGRVWKQYVRQFGKRYER